MVLNNNNNNNNNKTVTFSKEHENCTRCNKRGPPGIVLVMDNIEESSYVCRECACCEL